MGHIVVFTMLKRKPQSDYNHNFISLKIYIICPQNAFLKFVQRCKTGAGFETIA